MSIVIENVSKTFGRFVALDDVSLEVPDGDLLALLGPSGSGKTTLLRIIGGLEVADRGRVRLRGSDITEQSARERNVGFVFQHYALFRTMTVAENIGYALGVRKIPRKRVDERVSELLDLIQLSGLEMRYPGQLSGGQRQRVALARALAAEPSVLLLDEPFGALDAKVRRDLRQWVRKLHDEIHVTSIFVTHDQEEAMELADRVVVMNHGRIEQIGSAHELYERPASPFVFDFLGDANILPADMSGGGVFLPGARAPLVAQGAPPTGPVDVYVRPGDLRIAEAGGPGLPVRVQEVQRTGPIARVTATTSVGSHRVTIELPHLHHDVPRFRPGGLVDLRLMQFSVYPRTEAPTVEEASSLIGRERRRARMEHER
ncbi:MAG: sulfate/molybdate ABC transporter ATP-binding protein [Gemmatimonadales bacterium]